MQKNVLTKAIAVALATLGAGGAMAQSSVTIYGNVDVSVDHVNKSQGAAAASAKLNATRVSPSASSQTSFGFKGVEDLGGGMKASFVLEGQLNYDTGALSQDGRIFGRQSYVGLTTNFGEFRLGRQYAPIFYSTALVTTERFGATDLFIEGGASNNLHVRQDNQVSYWLKMGGFTGEVSYSPNAGVAATTSPARATTPPSAATGQIIGGATAGGEDGTQTGRTFGLFGAYAADALVLTGGYHLNYFNDVLNTSGYNVVYGATPTNFILDKYSAFNLGAKFTLPGSGISFNGVFGQGKYDLVGGRDLKLDFLAIGTRIPVGEWSLVAQLSHTRFRNFTKGKDTGVMLGADYALSKRTSLFTRVGQIKDSKGDVYSGGGPAIVGGPDVVGVNFGFRETPIFAGAGLNPDGKTTYVGLGIRHTF
ncbi:porin [Aquabacterium sp.]|uniref:porin n=1 Tax=Aquabacterium sp. TaxID=1872578 RepID=UPI001997FB20|nr:porin [Aquabacterium sp.]MBC7700201.1 porin [Aquabacterium sp.]